MATNPKFKQQMISVTISLSSVISSAINGIVAFIAVYFFKPLWEKLVKILDAKQDYWNKNEK